MSKEDMMREAVATAPFTEDTKCEFVGGVLDGKILTVAEVRKTGLVKGKMWDWSPERDKGGITPYRIFDNSPMVEGYMSAAWGGLLHPLRYETPEVYRSMSI